MALPTDWRTTQGRLLPGDTNDAINKTKGAAILRACREWVPSVGTKILEDVGVADTRRVGGFAAQQTAHSKRQVLLTAVPADTEN
jgi:hypothetical protein